ncbi:MULTISPECIES: TRAP transporter large permease [Paracoccaceae]|jgi:tripartite ATP-independent transporter DctM subunit|uniref:TRAP transporter large permease n=1 Tax=Rhodobacterales TaxID=204455 RepID=UPI001D0A4EB7|nr:TRAP transporter large permease [Boseongicola sp. H5]
MSWAVLLILAIGLLLAILFSGARIFVGFLLLNILGVLVLIGPRGFGMFSNSIFETATSSTLVTVALFVLMGEILFRSGTVDVLFSSIDRLIGRLRGRLYVVTIALSTVFGALSGSAVAVAAMLGRSVLPLMAARGYASRTSATTILAGASLAPIIPPSLLAIIVGSLADVSIAGLLVAGIIPGLLFATLTLAWVYLRGGPMPEADITQAQTPVWRAVLAMAPFLIVVFSVMGLILLGVASPSESAATGVVGAMVVAAIFGRLNWVMLREAVASAVTISVVILIIVASAKLFSQLLSFSGATRGLVTLIAELGWSPAMTFLLMMAIPFLLCMFIDQIAFMLLAIPIYQPIVAAMGFDPIWFWTIFLINLTVGSLTPPFGYTLFALKGAADGMSTAQVFRAAWPVVGIFLTGMAILWAVPDLVTAIPRALQ